MAFKLERYIVTALRKVFVWYPPRREALNKAQRGTQFQCAECEKHFGRKEVAVDHIEPVVRACGFEDWDKYVKRLFCDARNLQVLCKPCHRVKTKAENSERALYRKEKTGNGKGKNSK